MGNTWLLPAGTPAPNPGPLLRSGRLTELFPALRGLFAAVILDVPPLLKSPHAPLLTRFADGLIVTCQAGSTHSDDLKRAIEAAGNIEVRGIILNRTKHWVPRWVSKIAGISRTSLSD
jgi:Mrp family chromosome partitioning ATPase